LRAKRPSAARPATGRQQTADGRQQTADKTADKRLAKRASVVREEKEEADTFTVVTLVLHGCYTVLTLWLHCPCTAATLLLHCCYIVLTSVVREEKEAADTFTAMSPVCCLLSAVRCLLSTVYCLLSAVYCLLFAVSAFGSMGNSGEICLVSGTLYTLLCNTITVTLA
jgi:uncharacterized MAPEG superfamily protein